MKKAYFSGGCFWCIAPIFKVDGVASVTSGYCGGSTLNPTYEEVKSQMTDHRESIKIEYDEQKITYATLLDIFFTNVDPFDEEGQFIDRGHSYTLAVYYTSLEEKRLALAYIKRIQEQSQKEIYVTVEKFNKFYDAEEYHQDYYLKHPKEYEEELIKSGRKKGIQ